MTKEKRMLSIGRSRFFGMDEHQLMTLCLVGAVILIACAFTFNSKTKGVPGDAGTASVVRLHNGTMLAKR